MQMNSFTKDEIVLCIYAARYGSVDIGGVEAIHSIQGRSIDSIEMKIKNIISMCDEHDISRNTTVRPLTGCTTGKKGRLTNWKEVSEYAHVSRDQHLRECQTIISKAHS